MNVNQNRNVVHFVVQDGLITPGIIHVLLKKIANQFLVRLVYGIGKNKNGTNNLLD